MGSKKHKERKYKQMSLEVATRNPERLEKILKTFEKYEGTILNDDNILDIYCSLFLDGAIEARDITEEEIKNRNEKDNKINIKAYIIRKLKHNNEWGFPTGYQAAFTRYLKTLAEFGFIYAQYEEKLEISPIGKCLLQNEITLSEAFSLQAMRFWRKSPYRRVLNDFNYFEFIIDVLIKLNANNKKLSMPQFMVSLFEEKGDAEKFIKFIDKNKIGDSFEKAYQLVKKYYDKKDELHDGISKITTCFNDYGNTVFRVLQLTGYINVDYKGQILISFNKNKEDLYKFLKQKKFTISEKAKENEKAYFEETGKKIEDCINKILKYRKNKEVKKENYSKKIPNIIKSFDLNKEKVEEELLNIDGKNRVKSTIWFIQKPVKFEFLLTLLVYMYYGDKYIYKPNFLYDESGIPYSHAPGNIGDIEIMDSENYWLIEATLIRNKEQQINYETISLFRHLSKSKNVKKYLLLVAPYIHEDTKLILSTASILQLNSEESIDIYAMSQNIQEFIESTKQKENLKAIEEYSLNIMKETRKKLLSIKIK